MRTMCEPRMSRCLGRAPTFFSLPREIRDSIYGYALVSPSPLIVWAGMPLSPLFETLPELMIMTTSQYWDVSLSVQRLAPQLLRCNSTVSQEAALIFYSKNTFLFCRGFLWNTIVNWLEGIGRQNRQYLTSLSVELDKPQQVWQQRDGSRTKLPEHSNAAWQNTEENMREEVHPPHRLLSFPHKPDLREGVVDNISPGVETVLQLLGGDHVEVNAKLTITLNIKDKTYCGLVPGLQLGDDCEIDGWFSMDLPNILEKSRELYACRNGKSVEILWKCKLDAGKLPSRKEFLESLGWEILDMTDEDRLWNVDPSSVNGDGSGIRYIFGFESPQDTVLTLRRRAIEGEIVSDGPSPCSSHYLYTWTGL